MKSKIKQHCEDIFWNIRSETFSLVAVSKSKNAEFVSLFPSLKLGNAKNGIR